MNQTKKNKLLLFLFLATVIPTIIVYLEHAYVEFQASEKTISETKKIKTLAEFVFFGIIGIGYLVTMIAILCVPSAKITYYVIIIGTILIIVFYYLSRIYPVPIPFTDVVIRDTTIDWRDVVTKIFQSIMLPVVTALLMNNKKRE
jgi:hypothetical protein